jgi:HK97 gp10 family phage protein
MRSTLEGVAALTKQLNELSSLEEGRALRNAVRAGMKPALAQARITAPVGSEPHRLKNGLLVAPGYARGTVRVITTINAAKNIASAIMSTRALAFYEAVFVELGTHKMPAQPWLRRSLLETRAAGEAAFKDSIARAVARAAAKR